jgi:dTDP-glucose pyrophosphorylase
MWGIVPAAGLGTRIQPLAFSKELLPLCESRLEMERAPRAVSDYLIERLVVAGAERICFVIAPQKSDILEYYGGTARSADVCYAVQPRPAGLCDSIFRALPFVDLSQPVLIGLPDTIWFPVDALRGLRDDALSLLLFPVEHPEHFDAVVTDEGDRVLEVQVKQLSDSHWIWGAIKMPGAVLKDLFELWCERGRKYMYLGTLINAWLERGGSALGVRAGSSYFDVGTMEGYLFVLRMLSDGSPAIRTAENSLAPSSGFAL